MLSDETTYTPVSSVNLTKAKEEVDIVFDLLYQSDYI